MIKEASGSQNSFDGFDKLDQEKLIREQEILPIFGQL